MCGVWKYFVTFDQMEKRICECVLENIVQVKENSSLKIIPRNC